MIRLLRNRKLMVTVAAMALGASVVAGRERPSTEPSEPAAQLQAKIDVADGLDLDRLARAQPDAGATQPDALRADPFARRSFAPPGQQHAKASHARPARPSAPPLPFQYLGRLIERGKLEIIVARGEEVQTVAGGEQLGPDYRVDKVTETSVSFTYLPLKTKQTLDLPPAGN